MRLTDLQKDLPKLNDALQTVETTSNAVSAIQTRVAQLENNGTDSVHLKSSPDTLICGPATRGKFKFVASATGIKDVVQVCARDAAGVYAWRVIF